MPTGLCYVYFRALFVKRALFSYHVHFLGHRAEIFRRRNLCTIRLSRGNPHGSYSVNFAGWGGSDDPPVLCLQKPFRVWEGWLESSRLGLWGLGLKPKTQVVRMEKVWHAHVQRIYRFLGVRI